jgi:chemotaxis signal transduction protein
MTRATELRDAFDHGFSEPPPPPEPAHTAFLCIRLGGEPYAIALGDIASFHAGLRVVALPTRAPELLGMAAIRAAILPIYDLRIGLGISTAGSSTRWTVVARRAPVGFAFDGYDGHARIVASSIAAATQSGHVRGQFTFDGWARSVIDLPSVLTAIEQRGRPHGAAKEQ